MTKPKQRVGGNELFEKLSKKLVTTLCGMASLLYIATLIFYELIDHTHKIELYAMIIAAVGGLAGIHGLFQTRLDRAKLGVDNAIDKKG